MREVIDIEEIRKILKIKKEDDEKAAALLNDLLDERDKIDTRLKEAKKLIKGRNAIVCGAGPSLEDSIKKIKESKFLSNSVFISADGATSALLKYAIIPEIVVTDLDGKIDDIIKASENGSIVFIHAHGDNIKRLKRYVRKIKNVIGTCQVEPFGRLYNFNGFTDGDRAVFLALKFKAKRIILIGMDFDAEIGKYSFSYDPHKKEKKLKIAKSIIERLKRTKKKLLYLHEITEENL